MVPLASSAMAKVLVQIFQPMSRLGAEVALVIMPVHSWGGVLPLPITAALEIACYMGDATIADNSCVRVDACANMGGATIANNSCARSNACLSMGNDGIVNENSCNGYQACNQLIGTRENSTDIGENSW